MNDELNLKDLFTRLILFISRNFKLIFGIIFIGVISVILYQKFKTPYYETKAICMSGISEYERVEYEGRLVTTYRNRFSKSFRN